MKWSYFTAAFVVLFAVAAAEGEIWEEDDHEVLIRSERGAKNRGGNSETCRYDKGQWTECDPATTVRTRILTLKKGDVNQCEPTKTIQKKCKKACRYEKGTWSDCSNQSQTVRIDKLKSNSDPSCEQSRQITKKCKSKAAKPKNGKGMNGNYQNNSNRKNSSGFSPAQKKTKVAPKGEMRVVPQQWISPRRNCFPFDTPILAEETDVINNKKRNKGSSGRRTKKTKNVPSNDASQW